MVPVLKSTTKYVFFQGFPSSSAGKESACSAGDPSLIPGSEDPLEKRNAAHSSILACRIPMDTAASWAAVHGVAKSQTQLRPAQHMFSSVPDIETTIT